MRKSACIEITLGRKPDVALPLVRADAMREGNVERDHQLTDYGSVLTGHHVGLSRAGAGGPRFLVAPFRRGSGPRY